jgi:hypothetical protein
VLGDEISVSAKGMVYYAVANGCGATIYQIPDGGGSPSMVVAGRLPAISPDFSGGPMAAAGDRLAGFWSRIFGAGA